CDLKLTLDGTHLHHGRLPDWLRAFDPINETAVEASVVESSRQYYWTANARRDVESESPDVGSSGWNLAIKSSHSSVPNVMPVNRLFVVAHRTRPGTAAHH